MSPCGWNWIWSSDCARGKSNLPKIKVVKTDFAIWDSRLSLLSSFNVSFEVKA